MINQALLEIRIRNVRHELRNGENADKTDLKARIDKLQAQVQEPTVSSATKIGFNNLYAEYKKSRYYR